MRIGGLLRASLGAPSHRRRFQNVDAVQIYGGLQLSLLEVSVRHADAIQQFELVGASRCQPALLLVDDPVAKGMDGQISRPVLQQPLVLCSLVLARVLLDDPLGRLVLLERIPIGLLLPRLREKHDPQLVVPLDPHSADQVLT